MLLVGDDWAEAHHDIEIEDEAGRVLARRRVPEGLAGFTMLHELVAEHLDPAAEPDQVVPAYTASASALPAVLSTMAAQTEMLVGQLEQGFGQHPDAEIYRSQPGLGVILGARVLAEFGDDPSRGRAFWARSRARRCTWCRCSSLLSPRCAVRCQLRDHAGAWRGGPPRVPGCNPERRRPESDRGGSNISRNLFSAPRAHLNAIGHTPPAQ